MDSLAILRAVAFSIEALSLTASFSLRSSSFCLLFSAYRKKEEEKKEEKKEREQGKESVLWSFIL